MGIVTQCCLSKFIQKPNRGYFSNIVLKINTKLGGINSSIAQPSQLPFLGENVPTMVLGADVTHPPAGINNGVSIAALVGSVDRMYFFSLFF
jgi:eukaryotic translation initiation factor 2C